MFHALLDQARTQRVPAKVVGAGVLNPGSSHWKSQVCDKTQSAIQKSQNPYTFFNYLQLGECNYLQFVRCKRKNLQLGEWFSFPELSYSELLPY